MSTEQSACRAHDWGDAIPTLARWHHDEWVTITPQLSLADRIAELRRRATRGRIPNGFVAVVDGQVAGLACLVGT